MTIEKILTANAGNYTEWNQKLFEHIETQEKIGEIENDEHERVFFQTNELLSAIANNFFLFGKFKDEWDTSKCSMVLYGQYLLLKSKKMNLPFHWGVDRHDFFLDAYIIHPENLRFMNDDFWAMVLELKTLALFEFSGMGSLTAQEKLYFENKTSTIFQMIRSFMLFQVEKMNGSDYQHPPLMEIGQFLLKWDVYSDWDTLLEKMCRAFKLVYSINYQLWKISDLASKKPA